MYLYLVNNRSLNSIFMKSLFYVFGNSKHLFSFRTKSVPFKKPSNQWICWKNQIFLFYIQLSLFWQVTPLSYCRKHLMKYFFKCQTSFKLFQETLLALNKIVKFNCKLDCEEHHLQFSKCTACCQEISQRQQMTIYELYISVKDSLWLVILNC